MTEVSYRNVYHKGKINKQKFELPIVDVENPSLQYINKCDHLELFRNYNLVSKLQASVKSTLIECQYILKLKTIFDGWLFGCKTPYLEIPLNITIPDIRVDINQYKPSEWNPSVYALTNVDFPTAEELGIIKDKRNDDIVQLSENNNNKG